jgi:alcohol dehydrogenase class IV
MDFEIATAARIRFGPGTLAEVPPMAAQLGSRAFVATGSDSRRAAALIADLERHGISVSCFRIAHEPALPDVQAGIEAARSDRCDLVIGIGGGSVIDGAKVFAAMLANRGRLLDYLEVIGEGRPLASPGAPCIAIPTTAGTGAEVTRNAVLSAPEHGVKVSMRSPLMLPRLAVVDPVLTYSMPPALTAGTGLDALTQLLEAYVSKKATPFTDGLCLTGLKRAAAGLLRAFRDGQNTAARQDMCLASLFSGLALANAGLGAVHGIAGPVGGMFPAPHGTLCAALLPAVMAANVSALKSRSPASPALMRYREVARILTGRPDAGITDGIDWVSNLRRQLKIPGLSSYGVTERDFSAIAENALRASSMRGNPVELTEKEIFRVLEASMKA